MCCVVDCKNCERDLNVWDETICELHGHEMHKDCPCLCPFTMHHFLTGERNKLNPSSSARYPIKKER